MKDLALALECTLEQIQDFFQERVLMAEKQPTGSRGLAMESFWKDKVVASFMNMPVKYDYREATPDIEVFDLNGLKDSFADWLDGINDEDDDYDDE